LEAPLTNLEAFRALTGVYGWREEKHMSNENEESKDRGAQDLETLRDRVRSRLEQAGASQRRLEEVAGYGVGYMTKLLNGQRRLKASDIKLIAAALDKMAPSTAAVNTEAALVEGTHFVAVLVAGDDGDDEVVPTLFAQFDELRGRFAELEVAKKDADDRAAAADARVAALETAVIEAEKRTKEMELTSARETARADRVQAQLDDERRHRIEAEQRAARLQTQVDLPAPRTVGDQQYLRALANLGVTNWQSYARFLEAQKNQLEAELAKEKGKPGWGTAVVAGLLTFAAGAAVAATDDDKPKSKSRSKSV
jgi:transcriptional regulator with XRE-family HTH domain